MLTFERVTLACILCIALLASGGCGEQAAKPPSATRLSPRPADASVAARQVALSPITHAELQARLAELRGTVVVVDCWATSCAPCKKEFPHLVALSQKHPATRLRCISLSFDYQGLESLEEASIPVLKFLKEQQAHHVLNFINREEDTLLYEQLEIVSVPVILVYDRAGNLARKFHTTAERRLSYADVEELVEQLLEQESNLDKNEAASRSNGL